jgi:phosphoheptose isomerase
MSTPAAFEPRAAAPLTAAASPAKFPDARYSNAGAYFTEYAKEMTRASETIDPVAMERAGNVLIDAYARGSRMFSCGNGGSASIANHMQCDHLKGIRTGTDLAPQVLSLATNVEVLTAIANDIGYHDVFVYQLQSQARPGDVLIAVSSSGQALML